MPVIRRKHKHDAHAAIPASAAGCHIAAGHTPEIAAPQPEQRFPRMATNWLMNPWRRINNAPQAGQWVSSPPEPAALPW